jgi:hypothetical protein
MKLGKLAGIGGILLLASPSNLAEAVWAEHPPCATERAVSEGRREALEDCIAREAEEEVSASRAAPCGAELAGAITARRQLNDCINDHSWRKPSKKPQ